jgi:hypothetical protein
VAEVVSVEKGGQVAGRSRQTDIPGGRRAAARGGGGEDLDAISGQDRFGRSAVALAIAVED